MSEYLDRTFENLLDSADFESPAPLTLKERMERILKRPIGGEIPVPTRKVSSVTDGDTITLEDGTRVRLLGMNTPESTRSRERGGNEATARITELALGKQVRVQKADVDKYGREVGCVHVVGPDGGEMCLSQQMLAEGYGSAIKPLTHPYLPGQAKPEFDYWHLMSVGHKAAALGLVKGVLMPVSAFVPGLYEGTERELLRANREILAQATAAGFTGWQAELGSKSVGFAGEMVGMGVSYSPAFAAAGKVMGIGKSASLLGRFGRQMAAATAVGGVTGLTSHLEDGVSPIERVLEGAASFAVGEAMFAPFLRKAWKSELGERATAEIRSALKTSLGRNATEDTAEQLMDRVRVGQRVTPIEAQAVVAAAKNISNARYSPTVSQATKILEGYKKFLPGSTAIDPSLAVDNPNFGVRITFSEGGVALRPMHIPSVKGESPGGVSSFGRKVAEVRDQYFAAINEGRLLTVDKVEAAHPGAVTRFTNIWAGGADAVKQKVIIPRGTKGSVGEHGVIPKVGDTVTVRKPGSPETKATVVAGPPDVSDAFARESTGIAWIDEIDKALDTASIALGGNRAGMLMKRVRDGRGGWKIVPSPEANARYRESLAKRDPKGSILPVPFKPTLSIDASGVTPAVAKPLNLLPEEFQPTPYYTGPKNPLLVGREVQSVPVPRHDPLRKWQRDATAAFEALGKPLGNADELRPAWNRRFVIANWAEDLFLPDVKDPIQRAKMERAIEFLRRNKSPFVPEGLDVGLEGMEKPKPGHVWVKGPGASVPEQIALNTIYADVKVRLPKDAAFRAHQDGTSRMGIVDVEGRDVSWEPIDSYSREVRQVYQTTDVEADRHFPRAIIEADGSLTLSLDDVRQNLLETQTGLQVNALAVDMVEGSKARQLHQDPYPGKGTPKLATGDSVMDMPRPEYDSPRPPAGAVPFPINPQVRVGDEMVTKTDALAARELPHELGSRPLEGAIEPLRETTLMPRMVRVPEATWVKDAGVWRKTAKSGVSPLRETGDALTDVQLNRLQIAIDRSPDPVAMRARIANAGSTDELRSIMDELGVDWQALAKQKSTRAEVQRIFQESAKKPASAHAPVEEDESYLAGFEEFYPSEVESQWGFLEGPYEGQSRIRPMTRDVKVVGKAFLLGRDASLEQMGRLGPETTQTTNPAIIRARNAIRLLIERGLNPDTKVYLRIAHDGVHAGALESRLPLGKEVAWTAGEVANIESGLISVVKLQREAAVRGMQWVNATEGGVLRDSFNGTEKEFATRLEALEYISRQNVRTDLAPKIEAVAQNELGMGWANHYDPEIDSNRFMPARAQDLIASEMVAGKRPAVTVYSKTPETIQAVVKQLELQNKLPEGTFGTLVLEDPLLGDRKRIILYNKSLVDPIIRQNTGFIQKLAGMGKGKSYSVEEVLRRMANVPGGIEMFAGRDVKQAGFYAYARKYNAGEIWRKGVVKNDSAGAYREFENLDQEMQQLIRKEVPYKGSGDEWRPFEEDLDEVVRMDAENHGWPGGPLDEPPMAEFLHDEMVADFEASVPPGRIEAARVDLPLFRRLAIATGGIPRNVFAMIQKETGIPMYSWWMQIEGARKAMARFLGPREVQLKALAHGLTMDQRAEVTLLAEGKLAEMPGWQAHWARADSKLRLRAETYTKMLQDAAVEVGYTREAMDELLKNLPKLRASDGDYHRAFPSILPPKLMSMKKLLTGGQGLTLNERNLDFFSGGRRILRAMGNDQLMSASYNGAKDKILPFLRSAEDGGVPGLPDTARNLWWSYMREVQHVPDKFTIETSALVNKMLNKVFGKNPLNPEQTLDAVSLMTGANASHNLGWQPGLVIRNLVQPMAMNTPIIGVRYMAEGLRMAYAWGVKGKGQERFLAKHGITDVVKFMEDRYVVSTMTMAGPLRDAEATIQQISAGETGGSPAVRKALTAGAEFVEYGTMPYKWADDFNKVASWWGQYRRFKDAATELQAGKLDWDKFVDRSTLRMLADGELDPRHQIVKQNVMHALDTGEQVGIEKAARLTAHEFTSMTQFDYSRGNVPLPMQSGAGRLLFQYGTWPAYYASYLGSMLRRGSKVQALSHVAGFVATNYAISKVAEDVFGVDFARWLWAGPLGYSGSPMYQTVTGGTQVMSNALASPWAVDPETGIPFPVTRDPAARMAADRLMRQATQYMPFPSMFWPGEDMVPQLPDWPTASRNLKKVAGRPGRLWQAKSMMDRQEDPVEVFKTLLAMPSTKGKPSQW